MLAVLVLAGGLGAAGLAVALGSVPALAQPVPLEKRVRSVLVVTRLDAPELLEGRAEYVEDLPARSGQAMLCRSQRRYIGPVPSTSELAHYLRQGMGDAFLHVLRPEHKSRILADLVAVEAAYGAASQRRHQEVEAAKVSIKGTQDEYLIESRTEEGRMAKRALLKRKDRADRLRELWVSQSNAIREVHFRIDLAKFPAVAEFEREAARLDALRVALTHQRVAAVLESLGPEALDVGELTAAAERSRGGARRPR